MRKCNDSGYSLVEVLIGLLIFSIGSLASGMMIVTALQQNRQARERSVLAGIVAQRLEEIRDRPWSGAAGDSLLAGGRILDEGDLKTTGIPSLPTGYWQSFNRDRTGAADGTDNYYLIMWRIEDADDPRASGIELKRIVIRGAAMSWSQTENRFYPLAVFDHIGLIFRETKSG